MWPFAKLTARQKEIRRAKAERRRAWYRRLPEAPAALAGLATGVVAALTVVVLNTGGAVLGLRVNESVPRALTARVDFSLPDELQTQEARLRARDRSPNYYKLNEALIADIEGRLSTALTLAKAHADDQEKLARVAAENKVLLDQAGWAEIQRLAAEPAPDGYQRIVRTVIAALRRSPLVEPETAGTRRSPLEAVLVDPAAGSEARLPMTGLGFSNDPAAVAKVVEEAVREVPEALRRGFQESLLAMLRSEADGQAYHPLYRFDANRSVQRAQAEAESVPLVVQRYARGSPLADAGVLNADELRLLRAEHAAYLRSPEARRQVWASVLGRTLLAFLVVGGAVAYMRRYQHGVFRNHFRRVLSMVLLLLILAGTRFVFVSGAALPPHFAVGLQVLAVGLLAVVYRDEAVFAISGALAILMSMAVEQGIGFCVMLMAASGAMVFGLRVVRNRGKIVLVGAVAALIAFAASVAVGLLDGQTWRFVLADSLWAAGAALMAAFIIEGVVPGIERLFRLSTAMTLLEWCDASKPLLRMMAAEAPGTYNHSLLVGALAEAAAEAIGADGLLCRAGAYYHDIGKINKPEYFVENQAPGVSRHERLSPAMSLLVIIGHVKDGIEMAKEYGLPASLHPFIAEHHGTTLVQYFYQVATESRRPGEPEPTDTAFRYPGPKPQSRETAIVMLCDGVEGAVRAMPEPTPNRIETVVSDIIHKRLADGQFDECELTFRQLAEIEKSLVKSLCSIYHSRISYPSLEEARKPAAS